MWHPRPFIRFSLPVLQAPSQDEARASAVFQPFVSGRLKLARRTWVPAMVPWRAELDGTVNEAVVEWYRRFARGKPGAIVVEATGIRDIASGPLLRIGHDRYIDGLSRIAQAVREASEGETRLLIQVIDFLAIKRRPPALRFFREFLILRPEHRRFVAQALKRDENTILDSECREFLSNASDETIRSCLSLREWQDLRYGARERIDDLDNPDIAGLPDRLPKLFADAAMRAEVAGFCGVELHYAHAYTMASLLSRGNQRGDGFGQTLTGRLTLPVQVLKDVRAAVSDRFVVGLRMLSSECIDGGTQVEESSKIAIALARAGSDFISLSRGGKFEDALEPKIGHAAYPYTGPSGYECMPTVRSDARGPFGRNFGDSKRIRSALRAAGLDTPVVVAGGISTFDHLQHVIGDEIADIAAAARQTLADPDWFLKLERGLGSSIRRCEYTNYCEALDQEHKAVTCKLWDRQGLEEPNLLRTKDGRRRLVAP
jgi:2,4-dienoyl-CoA reductase-like NADH-dependent reductase (Old Yellow Enzyme family)